MGKRGRGPSGQFAASGPSRRLEGKLVGGWEGSHKSSTVDEVKRCPEIPLFVDHQVANHNCGGARDSGAAVHKYAARVSRTAADGWGGGGLRQDTSAPGIGSRSLLL